MAAFIFYHSLASTVFVTYNIFTVWHFDISSVVEKIVHKNIALCFEHTGSKYSTLNCRTFSLYVLKTVWTFEQP